MSFHAALRFAWIQAQRVLLIAAAITVIFLAVRLVIWLWPGKRKKAGGRVRFPALHKGVLKHVCRLLLVGSTGAVTIHILIVFLVLFPLFNTYAGFRFETCRVEDGQVDIRLEVYGSWGGVSGYYWYVEDEELILKPYWRCWPNFREGSYTNCFDISMYTDEPFERILAEDTAFGERKKELIWGGYTAEDFENLITGESTYEDVLYIANIEGGGWITEEDGRYTDEMLEYAGMKWGKLYWTQNGACCVYPLQGGGFILIEFTEEMIISGIKELAP